MIESITRLDECTAEQLAADDRADAYRAELAAFEEEYQRALFLSEATAAARREPTEAELQEHRLQQIREHVAALQSAIDELPTMTQWTEAAISLAMFKVAMGLDIAVA